MTWHNEREPAAYTAGERQAELEAHAPRPFTQAELNTDVRVKETGEIGRIMNIAADSGRVLVSGLSVRWWFKPEELERGRVVEAWEPEAPSAIEMTCACPRCHATPDAVRVPRNAPTPLECEACGERWTISWGKVEAV